MVTIEANKFFEKINDSSTYFIAARYNEKTTAIRIGEVLAVNPAEVSVSVEERAVLSEETINVEFTVAVNPTDAEYLSTLRGLGEEHPVQSQKQEEKKQG